MDPVWSLVLAMLSLALSAFLSVRSWIYGGSVITVQIDLVERRRLGADLTGSVNRWRTEEGWAFTPRRGLRLDMVKLTIRNKGRTAATIMDPALRIGKPPIPRGTWTFSPQGLLEDGETESVVRLESHDAKVFYFYLAPIVRGNWGQLGDIPLAIRGAITTGTGKTRLSRRWRGLSVTWNILRLAPGIDWIGLQTPTTADRLWLWSELTWHVYESPKTIAPQLVQEAARHAETGADAKGILAELQKLQDIFPNADSFQARDGWLHALASEAARSHEQHTHPSDSSDSRPTPRASPA